jgi:hypothetical protein
MITLHYGRRIAPLVTIKPDVRYPDMYRLHWPDGEISDMVNLTRAKDAAAVLVRQRYPDLPHDSKQLRWKVGESPAEAPPIDPNVLSDPGARVAPELTSEPATADKRQDR